MWSYEFLSGLCLGVTLGLGYSQKRLRYIHLFELLVLISYLHQYYQDYTKNLTLRNYYRSQPPDTACGEAWSNTILSLFHDECRTYHERYDMTVWPNPLAVARDLCANTLLFWLDYLGEHSGAAIHNFFGQQSYMLQILFIAAAVLIINSFFTVGSMAWMQRSMLTTIQALQPAKASSRFKQIV